MTLPPPSSPPRSDAELEARLTRLLADHYELDREIGRGGMGIVYRARDKRLKRPVAIKLLPPELAFRGEIRSRFLREAETAAQLSHPHIVPIYTVGEQEGLVFFVMAYVEGPTVARAIHDQGRLDPTEVRRILKEVADALSYAHARGVIHRDIKPDNILLDRESARAMVTDFGIARAAIEGSDSRLTATGMALGTPAYMSPEQCAGERELDGRSDLYSLGIVGYQMLTGTLPFEAANTPAMLVKHLSERPEPVTRRRADVPDDLARAIMLLLEKDPKDRFANGASLAAALAGDASAMPSPDASGRGRTRKGRRKNTPAEELGLEQLGLDELGLDELLSGGGIVVAGGSEHRPKRERGGARPARRSRKSVESFAERSVAERVKVVRRQAAAYLATTGMLFGINALTSPEFWWAFFPAMGMGVPLVMKLSTLWGDGIRLRDVFGSRPADRIAPHDGTPPAAVRAMSSPAEPAPMRQVDASAAPLVDEGVVIPRELLDAPRGAPLRQAVADRRAVRERVERLGQADRALLPDVLPTADALLARMIDLAGELHRLEADATTERLRETEARLSELERDATASPDGRRGELLRRQLQGVRELLATRDQFAERFESAALLLQNLALDMLRLRSAGVQSVLDDVTNVTQEARALAREIQAVLGAAEELRAIE